MNTSATSALLYVATITVGPSSPSPEDVGAKAHHLKDGKGFRNPWDSFKDQMPFELLKSITASRLRGEGYPNVKDVKLTVRKPQFLPTRETPKLRATWLGHACYYVEFPGGLRVLFDPVFEPRCSPFSFMGPKRYTPPPCTVDDIPFIDALVISHNHYDHLSHPTVKAIAKRFPNCQVFAPLGNKKWFVDSGITNVTELDWWEERDLTLSPSTSASDVSLHFEPNPGPKHADITATLSFLPSQHMTARGPFDRMTTLWGSWSIRSGNTSLYFGGDTGYRSVPQATLDNPTSTHPSLPHCPAFAQIGTHRGPFDLALIAIGAYKPRHIMSPMHVDPDDAVEIFRDIKAHKALGMHWGTWVLTDEDVEEPPRRLKEAVQREGLLTESGEERFTVLEHGESREF